MSAGVLGHREGTDGVSDGDNRATSRNSAQQLKVWRRGSLGNEGGKAASRGSVKGKELRREESEDGKQMHTG